MLGLYSIRFPAFIQVKGSFICVSYIYSAEKVLMFNIFSAQTLKFRIYLL